MFCPNCGAPNEKDAVFCGNCGAVLDPDAVPAEFEAEMENLDEPAEEKSGEAEIEEPEPEPEKMAVEPPPPPPARPASPAASEPPTSGMAVASLVLGIGGLTVLPLLGSIVAIVLGYMARSDIRRRPHEVSGDGLALAGIVLGWISVGLAILGILVVGGFMLCGLCGAFGSTSLQ